MTISVASAEYIRAYVRFELTTNSNSPVYEIANKLTRQLGCLDFGLKLELLILIGPVEFDRWRVCGRAQQCTGGTHQLPTVAVPKKVENEIA